VELNGVHGTVVVQRGAGNALRAMVRFPKLSALPTIIARLRRVFDLAADPVAITPGEGSGAGAFGQGAARAARGGRMGSV
jgi:AlkA N-terminal domain